MKSEPVQLVAVRETRGCWKISADGILLGRVTVVGSDNEGGWSIQGKRHWEPFWRAVDAAIALAKACGIENPIAPMDWP